MIEYRERQHSKHVPFFDDLPTLSGVSRGEQRRRYDGYRRTLLPRHGYKLVVFDYSNFRCTGAGRLLRTEQDRTIIAARLRRYTQISRLRGFGSGRL